METLDEYKSAQRAKSRQATRKHRARLTKFGIPEAQRVDAAISFALSNYVNSEAAHGNAVSDQMLKSILRTALADLEDQGFDVNECKPRLLRRLHPR